MLIQHLVHNGISFIQSVVIWWYAARLASKTKIYSSVLVVYYVDIIFQKLQGVLSSQDTFFGMEITSGIMYNNFRIYSHPDAARQSLTTSEDNLPALKRGEWSKSPRAWLFTVTPRMMTQ